MARWEPDARGRLEQAAMALFQERGYARTTVGEIAARAGLTERTFFRYFADKREVLFWGAGALEALMTGAIDAHPGAPPLEAVAAALEAAAGLLEPRREHARARHALIVAHPELRERELIKLATLAAAIAGTLRARGVAEPAASLAAEAGIAVFKVGFERWIEDPGAAGLPQHMRAALAELRAVTGESAAPAQPPPAARRPAKATTRRAAPRRRPGR